MRAQQALVAEADGLIFVAPVYWMGFPAILKGWFERVFAYGFAYTLTREGWQGDLEGRVPLLSQEKALILTPTFFTEEEYDKGWREAMDTVISSWGLKMAGVKEARHVYFYAAVAAGDEKRREYLAGGLPAGTGVLEEGVWRDDALDDLSSCRRVGAAAPCPIPIGG